MKRVLSKTETLLVHSQILRDSDKKLLLAFCETEGLHLNEIQRSIFMGCTPAESITRARRALKVKYPASKAVDDQRFELYKEMKGNGVFANAKLF